MATAVNPELIEAIQKSLNSKSIRVAWLAGDGSDRQYFRIFVTGTDTTYVLMLLSQEDGLKVADGHYEWILASNLLRASGISAPSLVAPIAEHNALVIDDYGDEMLQDRVDAALVAGNTELPQAMYKQAIDIILEVHNQRAAYGLFWTKASFDQEKYLWELNFFIKNYYDVCLKNKLSPSQASLLTDEFEALAAYLAPYSKYCVHRDYHSRNIMVHNDKLAIIDFQDLRLGPIAYDVVSLIFDSYVRLSTQDRASLVDYAKGTITEQFGPEVGDEFCETWKAVLLQRQLKAIGSFGYLTLVKQRGNYLRYVKSAVGLLKSIEPFDERWPTTSGLLLDTIEADE